MKINPLTEEQIEVLNNSTGEKITAARYLHNGGAVNILTGETCKRGVNVIYHPVYWDFPREFHVKTLGFLRENNKGMDFKVVYSD